MAQSHNVKLGLGLCLAGAGLGAIGIIGWLTGVGALVTLVPGQPPMMPNTAAALLLLGVAAALRHPRHSARVVRSLSVMAAIVVLAIGLGTIAEYALDLPFSIDQLIVRTEAGPYPGRPSPPTAVALAFLAVALLLSDWRPAGRIRPSELLILGAGLVALTALLGQLFGAGALYRFTRAPVIGVAVHTALSLLMISVGLLLERPDEGIMHVATSSGPGGMLMRRLLPGAMLVPVLFGLTAAWLVAVPGVENVELIFAALIVMSSMVSLWLLTTTAEHLNRAHDALEQNRQAARELIEHASEGIFISDLEGRFVDVNAVGCRMAGYSREEILGKTIADVIPPEDAERLRSHRAKLLEGSTELGEWALRRKDGSYLPVEVSAKILSDGRWQAFSRDISERKRGEETLRQTQERLELALKGADLATWDLNIITGEVIANPRCAEMRGFRPDELSSHVDSYMAGIHPDDVAAFQKGLGDCFEGTSPRFECEYRASTKSGDWVWILSRGKVFSRDEQGRATRVVGTALDVTARKRAEEALRLSEAKFSSIVSISPDAIVSIDEDQRITLFNEGAEKIFGRSKAEAIGAPLNILIPARFPDVGNHVENFAAGPDTARRMGMHRVIYGVRKNGEEFPADAAISKVVIDGKRVLTVTLRDITEQQRAETEQRLLAELGAVPAGTLEFEGRLTNIAELLVHDFADLCILDVIEEDGRVRRARVACQDPALGWVSDALMRPPANGEQPRVAGSVLETGQGVLIQKVTPDVISSWAQTDEDRTVFQRAGFQSAIGIPLVARGKALGTVSLLSLARVYGPEDLRVAETIAERAGLLLDNARLFDENKQAIQARDEILGIVAHDLRNPLAAIIALAAVLRRSASEHEVGEEVEHAANRMSRLIQDLIDVTRMEAGHRLSLRPARLRSAEVAAASLEAQARLASAASIELRLDLASELPDIWADRDRLLQVFENLIGNAIKFTKPGGQITLSAMVREGGVVFSVADTGSGIASNQLPNVFNRFWQAPNGKRPGAGLGLAIVKGIVEVHGGRIWVQSKPGQGSTFFFTIPAARSQNAPAPHDLS